MKHLTLPLGFLAMALVVTACGGGTQEAPAPETATAPAAPASEAGQLDITFASDPEPPRMGDNALTVTVMQGGQPVTDAEVSVTFFMAAMPEMKMPEMRNTVALTHDANGMYRGTGNVMMAGNWDATVTVRRGGQEIGSGEFAITAK